MFRVENVKMPRLLAFARHVEVETVKAQKPMSVTLNGEPDTAFYNRYFKEFGEGTRLAMPKKICAPDSSSLKPGSGGVLGQLDYMYMPDYWAMKIQDRRLHPVSGWDSSLRGRQAWQLGYEDSFLCNRLCVTLAPSDVYINRRV